MTSDRAGADGAKVTRADSDGAVGTIQRLMLAVREALRDAWAVLMPVECAGCRSDDRALCRECAHSLVPTPTVQVTIHGVSVFAALRYEGTVRNILLVFKAQQRTDQARGLSVPLLAAIRCAWDLSVPAAPAAHTPPRPSRLLIVPVPSSGKAFRARGYHPMSLVLRAAGVRQSRVLRVVRATSSQKLLGAEMRALNLVGAFVSTRWLAGARVIIVDDVLTTGATIDEAARAICAAGGTVIGAATIAFTPRTGVVRDIASGEGYGWQKGAQ